MPALDRPRPAPACPIGPLNGRSGDWSTARGAVDPAGRTIGPSANGLSLSGGGGKRRSAWLAEIRGTCCRHLRPGLRKSGRPSGSSEAQQRSGSAGKGRCPLAGREAVPPQGADRPWPTPATLNCPSVGGRRRTAALRCQMAEISILSILWRPSTSQRQACDEFTPWGKQRHIECPPSA